MGFIAVPSTLATTTNGTQKYDDVHIERRISFGPHFDLLSKRHFTLVVVIPLVCITALGCMMMAVMVLRRFYTRLRDSHWRPEPELQLDALEEARDSSSSQLIIPQSLNDVS